MSKLSPEAREASSVVAEALDLARAGTGAVHGKQARDVVTDTDVLIEDVIRRSLLASFDWPVIGEERGGTAPSDGPYWLVDPICGTRNFASDIPLFAVNVALVEAGRPRVAVVGDGSRSVVLVAEAGRGAWRSDGQLTPISTSEASLTLDFEAWPAAGPARDRAGALFASSVAADRWDVRCLGTTLALGQVACGQLAGCVLFASPGPEHTTAGALLVREAGGQVTDLSGGEWELGTTAILASADQDTHQTLLQHLAAGRPSAGDQA